MQALEICSIRVCTSNPFAGCRRGWRLLSHDFLRESGRSICQRCSLVECRNFCRADRVFVVIAEMRAHVVDHRRYLRFAEYHRRSGKSDGMFCPKRRHVAPSPQNRESHVLARGQGGVFRESRKSSSASCAAGISHVATLANMLKDVPPVGAAERRSVENTHGICARRRFPIKSVQCEKAQCTSGVQPARSGRI